MFCLCGLGTGENEQKIRVLKGKLSKVKRVPRHQSPSNRFSKNQDRHYSSGWRGTLFCVRLLRDLVTDD